MFRIRNFIKCALFLGCVCLMLLTSPTAWAEEPEAEIKVVKLWQQDNAETRPASISLELYADGKLVDTLVLSGDKDSSSWLGSFPSRPIYEGGRTIDYTVREKGDTNYKSIVTQQPKQAALSLSSWGEKITPASKSTYPIGSSNVLVANKGGNYFVWTRTALSANQQEQLIYLVNRAELQGLGKELSFANTTFRSGLPAFFEDSGVSINGSSGNASVEFEESSDWSLFYTGLLGIREAREAVIENRLIPTPTPSPLPTEQPEPETSPTPAPLLTLSVEKIWLDRDASQRSEQATIGIYRDGELWQTLILNEENGWQQSIQVPDRGESWSVKESPIPDGYSSEVRRDGNHFTVTNISKDIPATGDVSALEFYSVSSALCMMILTVVISLPFLIAKKKTD